VGRAGREGPVKAAGIDPAYFGVVLVMNDAVGLTTPPVGTVLNLACGVARVGMGDIMRGIWPFLLAKVLVLLLPSLFPAIVTVPANSFHG
jgi:TRAP-type C4-dicarboxylate transport system permease large subunit